MHQATQQSPQSPQSSKGWHKASYSSTSRECVEVREGARTAVRDTQHRQAGQLEFAAGEWGALIRAL